MNNIKLTSSEVATILGISQMQVIRLVKAGKLKSVINKENKYHYFSIDDVKKYINKENIVFNTKIITFANAKGGVGKTTVSLLFSSVLIYLGFKVLFVDLDKQGNSSEMLLGRIPGGDEPTVLDIFNGNTNRNLIYNSDYGIDLIPANLELSGNIKTRNIDTYNSLSRLIHENYVDTGKYDFIIFDTPPDLDITTEAALIASRYLVIVADADIWAIRGIDYLKQLVISVNRGYNRVKECEIIGCVFNKIRINVKTDKEIIEKTKDGVKGILRFKNFLKLSTQYKPNMVGYNNIIESNLNKAYKNRLLNLTMEIINETK